MPTLARHPTTLTFQNSTGLNTQFTQKHHPTYPWWGCRTFGKAPNRSGSCFLPALVAVVAGAVPQSHRKGPGTYKEERMIVFFGVWKGEDKTVLLFSKVQLGKYVHCINTIWWWINFQKCRYGVHQCTLFFPEYTRILNSKKGVADDSLSF